MTTQDRVTYCPGCHSRLTKMNDPIWRCGDCESAWTKGDIYPAGVYWQDAINHPKCPDCGAPLPDGGGCFHCEEARRLREEQAQ